MAASQCIALTCATITTLLLLALSVAPSTAEYGYPIADETSFVFKWHGEFIGVVDIPLPDDIDGWNMTITFERNIFGFEACAADVIDIDDKRMVHLQNQTWNAQYSAGDSLYFTFNAMTWKKIRGLVGTIEFWANVVEDEGPGDSSSSSSDDDGSSSAMGYDNGLDICNSTSGVMVAIDTNHTCGSSFELIASNGVTEAESTVPIDFAETNATSVQVSASESLAWFALDADFGTIFTLENGTVVDVGASVTVISNQVRNLNIVMTSKLKDQSGVLTARFRYPGTASGAVLFTYVEDTPKCPCSRLNLIE